MMQIKKRWTTKAGYAAVVLWVRDSHHCGYVRVPENHPFYKKEYNDHLDMGLWDKILNSEKVFRGSPMDLLIGSMDKEEGLGPRISYLFDVHGGITFGNHIQAKEFNENDWYFGYDCAHYNDITEYMKKDPEIMSFKGEATFKDLDFCIQECESLADQLKQFEGYNGNG